MKIDAHLPGDIAAKDWPAHAEQKQIRGFFADFELPANVMERLLEQDRAIKEKVAVDSEHLAMEATDRRDSSGCMAPFQAGCKPGFLEPSLAVPKEIGRIRRIGVLGDDESRLGFD